MPKSLPISILKHTTAFKEVGWENNSDKNEYKAKAQHLGDPKVTVDAVARIKGAFTSYSLALPSLARC